MVLDIGDAVRLWFQATNPPKEKRAIVVSTNPCWFFLINSSINNFQKKRPDILRGIVEIYFDGNNGILRHDSVVDCNEVIVPAAGWEELLEDEPHRYLGPIDRRARRAIRRGVTDSATLIGVHKTILLQQI